MHKIMQQGYMAVHCQESFSVLPFLDVELKELRLLWWQSGCRQPVQTRAKMNQTVSYFLHNKMGFHVSTNIHAVLQSTVLFKVLRPITDAENV